jgi:hypothetical protein
MVARLMLDPLVFLRLEEAAGATAAEEEEDGEPVAE